MSLGRREHNPISLRAEAAVPAARFCKPGTAVKGVVKASSAGEYAPYVSKFDVISGEIGLFHEDGDVLVEASEAIAVNAEVTTTNDGSAAVADSDDYILAIALGPALADGDLIEVRLIRGKNVKA